ncbi:MAG: protein-methionine-sulfoxide reductase catalytic subunit MsrP [Acidobacteria bacterium]|nr:MAG: protein-methionine-sulfoxide reductase catalytic subunit MsrP [Acidobacteriota bacterium]
MLVHRASDIPSSEITPERIYHNRREFIKTASTALGTAAVISILPGCMSSSASGTVQNKAKGPYDTDEKQTPYEDITTYNNYYEFGTDKSDPAAKSKNFKTKPWTVSVEGLVKKPATYALDDLIKGFTMEDRIYRMRCVEAWSMVIPWMGFPLAELIKRLEPAPAAKYVEFKTILAPDQMPGQRPGLFGGGLDWPYTEGLRLDEAMNPLALIAMGIYGKPLPNQNGAPLRLVTPWKYGFKGIKSIVKIRFVEKQPVSSWMEAWPQAYGFYANVNPQVDHPRWSQASERRLGEFYKRRTLMFNGYAEQVAQMYAGMDLRKNY